MSFRFEKDAIKSGKKSLAWGIIILVIFVTLQHYVFSRPDFPVVIVVICWFIGVLIAFISISTGISLLKSGGKWEIHIDNERITWNSPNETVDQSFDLFLKEIDRIVLRYRITRRSAKSSSSKKPDYIIVAKSGLEFELSRTSGVNLQMLFTELERKGISLVTEHV